jgi:hypothetical protein
MLEHGDVLMTWRLVTNPFDRSAFPVPARRIEDHRMAFLTYEGPISGDRGDVRRADAGTVQFEELTATRIVMNLEGGRLQGQYTLTTKGELLIRTHP